MLNQEQHPGEEGSRISLTNAAGLCRAAGELLARETIRRRKEMARESNYPSAKTDAGPDTGPSPGQAGVGSDVCTDCFYGGAGKQLLGVPCRVADGPALITVSWGRLEGTQLPSLGTLAHGAPRDSTLQPGMAVLCGDGAGAQAGLCWCKGRRVSAWLPLSRLILVKWAGAASPGMRVGRKGKVPVCLCCLKVHKDSAACY